MWFGSFLVLLGSTVFAIVHSTSRGEVHTNDEGYSRINFLHVLPPLIVQVLGRALGAVERLEFAGWGCRRNCRHSALHSVARAATGITKSPTPGICSFR